jgi:hypothetical protein
MPMIVMMAALGVQGFSALAMKRKMISGDEEYREPNKILRASTVIIVIAAIVMFIVSYLVIKLN